MSSVNATYISSTGSSSCNYYHWNVTEYYCDGSQQCQLQSGGITLIAMTTNSLTVGNYVIDCSTSKVFYISSYYGYGNYGGFIITDCGQNATCNNLCSV